MKIYTRTGDDGTTGLLGAGRVPKSSPRVEAYGSVDELNAFLGTVRALDPQGRLAEELAAIQSHLLQLGAELAATTPKATEQLALLGDSDVAALEATIDRLDAELAPLKRFILPGGTVSAAQLHVARAVCRRAERRLVALGEAETVERRLVRYLNRLGDLLFVMARWCNHQAAVKDVEWRPPRGSRG